MKLLLCTQCKAILRRHPVAAKAPCPHCGSKAFQHLPEDWNPSQRKRPLYPCEKGMECPRTRGGICPGGKSC